MAETTRHERWMARQTKGGVRQSLSEIYTDAPVPEGHSNLVAHAWGDTSEEATKRALLIAAAPSLLAELHRLRSACPAPEAVSTSDEFDPPSFVAEGLRVYREALASADALLAEVARG